MSLYAMEPRDPLVVRDGRPNHGRSESATLPFPYPSTVAGIVRTRLGSNEQGVFTCQDLAALKKVALRGPLLVQPEQGRLYVPAPRDAVKHGDCLGQLLPVEVPDGALVGDGLDGVALPFGGAAKHTKHAGRLPTFWDWEAFAAWLSNPRDVCKRPIVEPLKNALERLEQEPRLHVKVSEQGTAEDSFLFETQGLRFVTPQKEPLALLVDVESGAFGARALRTGILPFAGERRLAYLSSVSMTLPGLLPAVREALLAPAKTVRVRLVLLTPGIFEAGARPGSAEGQLLATREGVKPTLRAACVPRPQVISGWDFEKRAPKATRRMVPSGSVYWVDLEGSPEARLAWAERVMMQNGSDHPQDRLDGFGLVAVGVGE